jgi:methylglyoxal synthase
MDFQTVTMGARKTIVLVAHDHKKPDLLAWAKFNLHVLAQHRLMAIGTTGTLLETGLRLPVGRLQSGPLGGDQ